MKNNSSRKLDVGNSGTSYKGDPEWLKRIRDQRDRFMGFAFSGSDLLIETDTKGNIIFCAGAVQSMVGLTPDQLKSKEISSLFSGKDKNIINQLIELEFSGRRWGPITMEMTTPGFATARQVAVCSLRPRPDREIISFTITPIALAGNASSQRKSDVDPNTGLMMRQEFIERACQAFSDASVVKEQLALTAINLSWLNELDEDLNRFGPNARNVIIDNLLSTLRLYAVNNMLTQVSECKFVIVHVPIEYGGRSIDMIQNSIDNIYTERLAKVAVHPIGTKEKLTGKEFFEAMRYTLSQMALKKDWNIEYDGLSNALEHKLSEAVSRISWFKRALLNRDIAVVAQPIVDLEKREIHHYEVNVRFQGDESPAALISFAEEIGIIHELDYVIAELTLAHLNGPKATHRNIGLAVNISGNSILKPSIVPRLINLMSTGLKNSSRIMFELTESFKIEDLEAANEAIQKLRRAGYRVCLDDLDAGAASLEYMEAFEVDFIKLDGHSVHRGMESRRHALVVESLVRLSNRLRAEVIAEMIETEEQAAWVSSLGANYGQGYLFGRPEPLENISGRMLTVKKS